MTSRSSFRSSARSFAGAALLTAALAALGALGACATSPADPDDSGLEGLSLSSVRPGLVVPGSRLVVAGASFVNSEWGTSWLHLEGTFTAAGADSPVDMFAPARFVDFHTLEVAVDADFLAQLGGAEGEFTGTAIVEVTSKVDDTLYVTDAVATPLSVRSALTPRIITIQNSGLIFVNDSISVEGEGFLLGGEEGATYAVVAGCFALEGGATCEPVAVQEVPVVPDSVFSRTRGRFAFGPAIAGIRPGTFRGTVLLRNRPPSGTAAESSSQSVDYDLIAPTIFSLNTSSASLGQYLDVDGGGFVGGAPGTDTLLRLVGTWTPTDAPSGAPVDLLLIPEFVEGRRVRYVLSEDDALGQAIDLRSDTGSFTGDLTPVIHYGADEVIGDGTAITFSILPVKQVVYLNFLPSFVESLRDFGLRAVDAHIRARIAESVKRDFAGINVEVRDEVPTDFALYSEVQIGGPDPNGLGLFGYDNTPGKDTGNVRLYDRIGGVNATTQEDGYPGYGGVFIQSLFGFSEHPGELATPVGGANSLFDLVFDPFRPDRDGDRVRTADLTIGFPMLTSGDVCPSAQRPERIACAIWTIGNLVGGTVSHELGHSLGLANPYGAGFHNLGDGADRLMDGGGDRPFAERAQLMGAGPAVFCDTAYDYLRELLPVGGADPIARRPSCL